MINDRQGNAVSNASAEAVSALDKGIAQLNSFRGDPVRVVGAAVKAEPDFVMGHIFLASLFATAMDKALLPHTMRALDAAEALAATANDRERGHLAAVRKWVDGDIAGATEGWGRVALDHPRDILATQMAHQGDFFLGQSLMLRDRIERVLPHWRHTDPGYGFLLGMYAFGLEEAGEYRKAEQVGREAMSLNPQDAWATHAVAHVIEMEGRAHLGARWLEDSAAHWQEEGLHAYHLWWHLALMHMDTGDFDAALRVFDSRNTPLGFGQALQLVDAASLLWRLWVLGHDVGERWTPVADAFAERIDHGINAFNDAHAMLAFVATGRSKEAAAQMATLERAAKEAGDNALMSAMVGLPVARGITAFGEGRYQAAVDELMAAMPRAALFGGSHAQRDILPWTANEAAIRAGDTHAGAALAQVRLKAKPECAVSRIFARRSGLI